MMPGQLRQTRLAASLLLSAPDLAQLLGRPATPLTKVVGTVNDAVLDAARDRRGHKAQRHGRPAAT
jgi:hypothetical protein